MIELRINNKTYRVEGVDRRTPLLWVLRDNLGLTGTKYGCGKGECGSCTVHIDGEAVRSCRKRVSSIGDAEITTIEGLSKDGSHPVQQAWRTRCRNAATVKSARSCRPPRSSMKRRTRPMRTSTKA